MKVPCVGSAAWGLWRALMCRRRLPAGSLVPFPSHTATPCAPPHVACVSCVQETAGQKRTIKSIKAREAELRQQGVSAARAGKIAAGMVTGVKSKKQKKRKVGGQSRWMQ
mgnify:CR=1 FL=1